VTVRSTQQEYLLQKVNYDGITGKVSKNRAGRANGGADGLEGDGPLEARRFGTHAINTKLVSIERSDGGDITTPISPKQFESICALTAYWFDYAQAVGNIWKQEYAKINVISILMRRPECAVDAV
jgi:hypothetical protein